MKKPWQRKKNSLDFIEDEAKELKKEYKHFKKFRGENGLLLSVFLIAIVAVLVINTVFWVRWARDNERRRTEERTLYIQNDVVKSGLPVATGAMKVIVKNVSRNDTPDPAFQLEDGMVMLIMDVTVTNTSDTTQQLIPVSQFYARSRSGDYSPLHASTYVTNPLAAQDLAPGAMVTGQVSFGILKTLDTPLLYVDTGWDNSVPIVIDVLH